MEVGKIRLLVLDVFMHIMGVSAEDIDNNTTNNDIQMDSLDKVNIVMTMETRFCIAINDHEFDKLRQFSDYVSLVEEKLK